MFSKIKSIHALAVLLCATTAASAQENRGTPEQRAACAPDAVRLCIGFIPEPTSVEQCLRRNELDLSEACRSVFEQSAGTVATKSIQRQAPARATRPATSREAE